MEEYKSYMGKDGLLHCASCGGAIQRRLKTPMFGRDIFPATCPCREEQYEKERREHQTREHEITVEHNRSVCFPEKRMVKWTFENDDALTPAMKYGRTYVEDWERIKKEGIGLLLWGDVGTGKTYMAAAIANALIEKEQRVLMTDFATISNISVFDADEYIMSLGQYDLLIIDDLGAERRSEFSLQNVFNVVNRRWVSGKPMIVTTNLTLDQIRETDADNIAKLRIYDRILEMCKPIQMEGNSRRKDTGKAKMKYLKSLFCGEEEDHAREDE